MSSSWRTVALPMVMSVFFFSCAIRFGSETVWPLTNSKNRQALVARGWPVNGVPITANKWLLNDVLKEEWGFTALVVAVTLIVNYIYLRPGGLPAKYLAPGVLFLLAFQVYVVFFSGFIAFTNYGSLHNGSQESALDAITQSAVVPVEGASTYDLKLVKSPEGRVEFLVTNFDDSTVYLGGTDYKEDPYHQITPADAAEFVKRSSQIDDEWVADMNKRGFDGNKLLDTAKALIAKHGK
mgnify:CR=1 FL=1